MDFVPFTLFFMVCLLSFQGNVSGKPATEADLKDLLAEKCKKELSSKNYCTEKLTGHGYPSVEELKKLYDDNIGKIDFPSHYNQTGDRVGTPVCITHKYVIHNITMIKDVHDNIRYTLYIPDVYEMWIPVEECKPHANKMITDIEYIENNMKCVQESFQYPFLVLSQDKKSLEFVKIKGLHSSCDFVQVK